MRSIRVLPPAFVALVVVGCAPAAPATETPPPTRVVADTVFRVDTVRLEVESSVNPELENQIARLQIQILERDARTQELRAELDETRLELVRNMARLQTQASRAEAASGMSEAEIALGALGRSPGGEALPEYGRAASLLEQSSAAFGEENYGGALYLATQVRGIVRNAQGRLSGGAVGTLRHGEALFDSPIPLQTVGRSNVRSGPGLGFDVIFTLDAASQLVGQSYTGQWIQVVDGESRQGWIFHTLVSSR